MRGSAAFRTSVTPGGALAGPWVRNPLWNAARSVPSLDLRFADNKSLVDATTGQNLVTFTRASSGTYVDSQGVIRTATTNLQRHSEDFTQGLTPSNATLTANQGLAPNGTITADQFLETTANGLHSQEIADHVFIAGAAYTFSCYAKSIGGRNFAPGFPTLFGSARFGFFNLSGGGSVVNTDAGVTASIQAVGDGWYRCSITSTCVTGGGARVGVFIASGTSISYVGDAAKGLLLWGAQLEQSSTVGEYIPTTSTINSAPRFDHNPTTGESLGLLVEEQRTNSIRNNTMVGAVAGTPGTLPSSGWQVFAASGLTTTVVGLGTQNGLNYIDLRLSGTSTTSFYVIGFDNAGTSASAGQSWTESLWVSLVGGSLSNVVSCNVNLRWSGGSTTDTSFTPTASLARVSGIGVAPAGTTNVIAALYLNINSTSAIDLTLRIAAPQLEAGAFPTSYIPTTTTAVTRSADVASISGSNFGTFRTNLLLRSEEFDNASWSKIRSTVSANGTLAPNGTTTADKFIEDTTASSTHIIVQGASVTSGTTYAASFYLKAGERSSIYLSLSVSFAGGTDAIFNASTGVATNLGVTSCSMTPVGNGWYRCVAIATANATGTGNFNLYSYNGSTIVYTGDGTSGIYLWGAQLETGSTATAYIPTTTAAVTVFESSWYRQDEGTVFVDAASRSTSTQNAIRTQFDSSGSNQIIGLYHQTDEQAVFRVRIGETNIFTTGFGSLIDGVGSKTTMTYKSGDNAACLNGGTVTTNTSAYSQPSSVSVARIGTNQVSGEHLNGTIRRLTYFPTRLANSTLQQITQ